MMIVYKTKTSPLIKILFLIVLICVLIFALIEKSLALLSIAICFTLVTVYIFKTTHYTVYNHLLTIKSGFIFKEIVPIDSIKKITKAKKNLLTGPGFSPDRLIIIYNDKDCVIISPAQQAAFLSHIKRINPDISFEQ